MNKNSSLYIDPYFYSEDPDEESINITVDLLDSDDGHTIKTIPLTVILFGNLWTVWYDHKLINNLKGWFQLDIVDQILSKIDRNFKDLERVNT